MDSTDASGGSLGLAAGPSGCGGAFLLALIGLRLPPPTVRGVTAGCLALCLMAPALPDGVLVGEGMAVTPLVEGGGPVYCLAVPRG